MLRENDRATKEWAVVVDALERGRQVILLRKADDPAARQSEFWVYPSFTHQSEEDLLPEAAEALSRVAEREPETGTLALRHYVEVVRAIPVRDEVALARLSPYHIWSKEGVSSRLERSGDAGLVALVARVHVRAKPHVIDLEEEYTGCKAWTPLKLSLSTDNLRPALPEERFLALIEGIR